MTAKQKAQEIIGRHSQLQFGVGDMFSNKELAKQSSLFHVDQIIDIVTMYIGNANYWIEVKRELENL